MAWLEDLTPKTSLRGILPDCLVEIIAVEWFGSEALEITFKDPSGKLANQLLYRADEPRIDIAQTGRAWSFDADGHLFRLVSEAHRIRLAHLFDPVLAVHTSIVEPLPHQITAVYEAMLPRQPLRFLLADDPGAAKSLQLGQAVTEELEVCAQRGDPVRWGPLVNIQEEPTTNRISFQTVVAQAVSEVMQSTSRQQGRGISQLNPSRLKRLLQTAHLGS